MMIDADFYWLVGLLEGEGCFQYYKPNRIVVTVGMTDEDVIARAARLMGCRYRCQLSKRQNAKPMYVATILGQKAADLMGSVRLHLGARRQAKVCAALAAYQGPLRRACSRNENRIVSMLGAGMTHAQVAAVIGCTSSNISAYAVRLRAKGAQIPDKRHKALPRLSEIAALLQSGLLHREAATTLGCSRASISRCAIILRKNGFKFPDLRGKVAHRGLKSRMPSL